MKKLKQLLRDWLGVPEVPNIKKLEKQIVEAAQESVKKDMDYWNGVFKKIGEIDCSFCGKKIVTYPFGGGYYRDFDGTVYHSEECRKKARSIPKTKANKSVGTQHTPISGTADIQPGKTVNIPIEKIIKQANKGKDE